MSKFNSRGSAPQATSPIKATVRALTHEGGDAFALDEKGELFNLATTNMVSEDTFYESAGERDSRFTTLIHSLALADPAWVAAMLKWLRTDGNMRSASLVGAAEFAAARRQLPDSGARKVIASVLQRADEPGEFLAYWTSRYGRTLPKPVKRGVADGAVALYNERSFLKYDSDSRGFRFGDVVELTHPKAKADWQGALFKHAIDVRQGRDVNYAELELAMVRKRHDLGQLTLKERRLLLGPDLLASAGMTWESVAGWLQGQMDAKAWEAVIPSMGYMALIRNLRNFDAAGISDAAVATINARLVDPEAVAGSRQLPFRFYSAFSAVNSLRYSQSLETALDMSVANIPELPGRTLILVDTSGSMQATLSAKSKMSRVEAAALFGAAVAVRNPGRVDLHGFADHAFRQSITKGASTLVTARALRARVGEAGHGTQMAEAVRSTLQNHDRVIIFSDMQAFGDFRGGVEQVLPAGVKGYAFDLAGYGTTVLDVGGAGRHQLGGLTDATFRQIPEIEQGRNAGWPWESADEQKG